MWLTEIFISKMEISPNINQDDQGKSILPITAIPMRHAIIESPSISQECGLRKGTTSDTHRLEETEKVQECLLCPCNKA
jgi:hypothetical protein